MGWLTMPRLTNLRRPARAGGEVTHAASHSKGSGHNNASRPAPLAHPTAPAQPAQIAQLIETRERVLPCS
ncbi:hypothetical protein HBI56_012390 [Parastagonospora nodorum]|nr:hypothetical protein HBH53_171460 [Parastagonospora nodorum]KAH3986837.1 hypothetical protein HBH51_014090 [Parastagonospora nodorum]KAH4033612.1 hypothetical protein HBI13_012780 [Parastagonospora nodorum]KAH4042422.1 hypothetical protein HBI09_012760 [Parastagonospora nodorum]KAH4099880.1 hypothetical protein HBH48_012990 [Parastagonospora nodorum]